MNSEKRRVWMKKLSAACSFSLPSAARLKRLKKRKSDISKQNIFPVKLPKNIPNMQDSQCPTLKKKNINSLLHNSSIEMVRDASYSTDKFKSSLLSLSKNISLEYGKECQEMIKNSTPCENALNIQEVYSPKNLSDISGQKMVKIPYVTPKSQKIPKMVPQPSRPMKQTWHSMGILKDMYSSDYKIQSERVVPVKKLCKEVKDVCPPKKESEEFVSSNMLKNLANNEGILQLESNKYYELKNNDNKEMENKEHYGKITSTPVKHCTLSFSPNVSEINSGDDGSGLMPHISRVMISDSCPSYETLESPKVKTDESKEMEFTDTKAKNTVCCIATLHDFPVLPCNIPTKKVFNLPPFLDYGEDILLV